ncbi:MAG: DUF951 domain-containing protein [Anaerolineae bacterium]|nr:DUF951 domain-containing protein [Anaerolineae bacterium]
MIDVRLGDHIQMRKAHPCGNDLWEVVRVGTDIGLRCLRCGRVVQMPRSQFNRQAKQVVKPSPPPAPS